jgi:beta-lactamase class A
MPTHRRRRSPRRLSGLLLLVVAAGLGIAVLASVGHKSPELVRSTAPSKSTKTTKVTKSDLDADPLTSAAVRSYLAHRTGNISIAIDDLRTGQTFTYRPGIDEQTASIVKVTILATRLDETQSAGPLGEEDAETATGMIEESDNDDATDLWSEDGGAPAIARFCASAGCTDTHPNTQGYWGETLTTASDQIAILRQLIDPHSLLTPTSQAYELNLMRNVTSWERWGVPTGIPAGVSVAVKNGWVPIVAGNWQINTIGYVDAPGANAERYLLAILTNNDPTENYGIATDNALSQDIWRDLNPFTPTDK